jgi:hypothetical protein
MYKRLKDVKGGDGVKSIYVASCILSLLATASMALTTFAPFWQFEGNRHFGLIGVVECATANTTINCTLITYKEYAHGNTTTMAVVSPITFTLGIAASIVGLVATIYWFLKALNRVIINFFLQITLPNPIKQLLYISPLLAIGCEAIVIILFFVFYPSFAPFFFCPWLAIASVPVMFVGWIIVLVRKRKQKKQRFCCC